MSVQVTAPGPPADVSVKKDNVEIEVAPVSTPSEGNYIVQSPYTDQEHLLDLDTLDHENALLGRALGVMRSTREDYATAPYTDSFNWGEVMTELKRLADESDKDFKETSFYVVAFRSQIKPSTDTSHLGDLDKAAHAEAVASGGFLKYWFGTPDSELRNLATCLWRSREDAIAGGRGPAHRKAAGSTRSLYAYWKIDQHRLIVRDGAESWDIVPWGE